MFAVGLFNLYHVPGLYSLLFFFFGSSKVLAREHDMAEAEGKDRDKGSDGIKINRPTTLISLCSCFECSGDIGHSGRTLDLTGDWWTVGDIAMTAPGKRNKKEPDYPIYI